MGRLHLYRNISIIFIIFAAVILCAVFLMFYSQATVVVSANRQKVNLNFATEIKTSSTPSEAVKREAIVGTVSVTSTKVSAIFNASSTRSASGETSNLVGKVTIKNDGSQAQLLVKTTQLQAGNGVIVRTNNEVKIPASGSVEVEVYPKEPETFQSITAGRLTIIKLPVPLQSKIYGEVSGALEKQQPTTEGQVHYVADSDVNLAKQELIAKAVNKVASSYPTAIVRGELIGFELDKRIGDEAKTFTLTATIKIKIIKPDQEQLADLIKAKAKKADVNGLLLDNIDLSQVEYSSVDSTNPESIAIKINYPLEAYLSEDNDLLNKSNFTNKTTQEIKDWATNSGVIKSAEVIISPYWREKTPQDPRRIKIVIQ